MSQTSQKLELLVEQLRCENETLLKENQDLSQEVVSLCHELARAGKKPGSKDQKEETIVSARDAAPRVDSVAILRRYHFTLPDNSNSTPDTGSGQWGEEKRDGGNPRMILEESPKKSNGGRGEQKPPVTGYYEVMLNNKATTIDYKKDYRRFSYTDFRLSNVHTHTQHAQSHDALGGNNKPVALEDVIRWADKVYPRTQDDVMPLLMLCKDVISKILTEKLNVNTAHENQLKTKLEAKEHEQADALAKCSELQAKVREQQDVIARLMIVNGENRDKIKRLEDKTRETELEEELRGKNELVASLQAEAEALRSAMGVLEKRVRAELDRATKRDTKEPPRSPSDIVASLPATQLSDLVCCALRKHPSLGTLTPANLEQVSADTCRSVCRALITRLRTCSASWVKELAELLDTTPAGLPGELVKIYEDEMALKRAAKGKDMQVLMELAHVDNFLPMAEALKKAVENGAISTEAAISECTGKTKEALLHEWTAVPAAELQLLLRHKVDFSRWLSRKDDASRAHHRAADRRAHVGMIDLSAVDDFRGAKMPIGEANVCVCGIFAMKRCWDERCSKTGQQLVNIMRVTRVFFIRSYGRRSLAETHQNRFLATVVEQSRSVANKKPPLSKRCVVFARVAGIIAPEEWCEASACFLVDFYTHAKDLVLKIQRKAAKRANPGRDGQQEDDESSSDTDEEAAAAVRDVDSQDVSGVMREFVMALGECDVLMPFSDLHMITGKVIAGRHGTCVAHRSVDQLLERAAKRHNNSDKNHDAGDGDTAEGGAVVRECVDAGSGGGFEAALWEDKNVTFEEFQRNRIRVHQHGLPELRARELGHDLATTDTAKDVGVWVDGVALELLDMWHRCKEHRDASLRALHKEIFLKCGGAFDLGTFAALMLRALPNSSARAHAHLVSDRDIEALYTQLAGPSDQIDPTEFIDSIRDLLAGNPYCPGPLDPTLPADHVMKMSKPATRSVAALAAAGGDDARIATAGAGGTSPGSAAAVGASSTRSPDSPLDQRALVNGVKFKEEISAPSHGEGI